MHSSMVATTAHQPSTSTPLLAGCPPVPSVFSNRCQSLPSSQLKAPGLENDGFTIIDGTRFNRITFAAIVAVDPVTSIAGRLATTGLVTVGLEGLCGRFENRNVKTTAWSAFDRYDPRAKRQPAAGFQFKLVLNDWEPCMTETSALRYRY